MRLFSSLLLVALQVLPVGAGAPGGARLDYRIKVRLREEPEALATGFRMIASPGLVTRNKVKRPRMGSWQIEPLAGGGAPPSAALLARALRLCYFSGPTPQAVPLATGLTIGGRWCRLWQVKTPPQVGAYVYLVEVAPGLLALDYLSASLPDGDIGSVEIHLAGLTLGAHPVPAEEGTALLKTLRLWADQAGAPADAETEEIP